MESINFEFLRNRWPYLADLGGFAEKYVCDDPSSSLVKLRNFTEQMLLWIYDVTKLEKPFKANLYDLLEDLKERELVKPVVLDKFHQLRLLGNKAAHGQRVSKDEAVFGLQEAYDVARWLLLTIEPDKADECAVFVMPDFSIEDQFELMASKEAELKKALLKLDEERKKTKQALQEVDSLQKYGARAVNELQFNEAETRKRLIDTQIAAAGWDLNNKDEVGIEVEVLHQPTDSGVGYADYVLWDDNGKPLAVIEAKRTSESAGKGRTQARCYADGLQEMTGQRPVIFYTNGFDIFIWDDHPKQGYPERKIYGFYSKDSLQYLVQQRNKKLALNSIKLDMDIANRNYQMDAIHSAFEDFENKRRRGLFVLATGTGKTRVSVSMTDALIRARWARRVLFLCDRVELRKQAKNAFNEFIKEPSVDVKSSTYKQRDKRIYFSTYPAMMKVFQTFDVGFFDLIIADESHRSIYNIYRDIFSYFDCLQMGLTATPKANINQNTYELFGRKKEDPTSYYSYEQGVDDNYLVPFELFTHTTKFLRDGIKYKDLTDEQREQLEEDGIDPQTLDYNKSQVDKLVYNKDTNRMILRNLMENGIRDKDGQLPGKTIIFARNHRHAELLATLFNEELYPQYGGKFCQVIDNYDPRAEQLIDDFKDKDNELTIAVSVDMLDTGIDVPEVVNLSFAKPVKSFVKFWQMIGRGTRLCPDLFGPGLDKQMFRIFDHWDNFGYFEQQVTEAEPSKNKSLAQILFESRVELAETALKKGELAVFADVVKLIRKDIADLPETSIAVRDKWREKRSVEKDGVLEEFHPNTVQALKNDIAPLMQWTNIRGRVEAKQFDLLMSRLQKELFAQSGMFDDLRAQVQNEVNLLPMHLNPVRVKAEAIKQVQDSSFWSGINFKDSEQLRKELRGIMQYKQRPTGPTNEPDIIDVSDSGEEYSRRKTTLTTVEMEAYKRRVHSVLEPLFAQNITLKKIRSSEPISEDEFKGLTSLVLTQYPDVNLETLKEFYPATVPLEVVMRSIVGMDIKVVEMKFAEFMSRYGGQLSSVQRNFLMTLQRLISNNGAVKVSQLYDAPFTSLHSDGVDGVFYDDNQIDELIDIIKGFDPETYGDGQQI
ncbi:DEAD/DEAH box helicase family protein [Maridesulfovibrio sp.]|uniref:DEAD/DEAH box helicase family protein n=1 Tax=Maridesulfovibrio sp. TaxID=2795000 RepID=UPI0029CA9267|nr:DEAD/DEAH box helicase family protein [Maridesulfovibrio sp.]